MRQLSPAGQQANAILSSGDDQAKKDVETWFGSLP